MNEQIKIIFLKPGLPTYKELESVIHSPVDQLSKRKKSSLNNHCSRM